MPSVEDLAAYRAEKSRPQSPTTASESPSESLPALPAPDATGAAQATVNGIPATAPNTWAKDRSGGWVVRGKPGQTGVVTVVRKSGTTSREIIKRVIWQDGNVALYEV